MEIIKDLLILLGRICVGVSFLWAASEKIFHWKRSVAYMESKKMPHISLFLPVALIIQLLSALTILLGYHARLGSLILILFTGPAALIFHDFWNVEGDAHAIEKALFIKDCAICGGLLLLLAMGPGRFSLISGSF